jgi:uncharacterized protein (DUF2252 family)
MTTVHERAEHPTRRERAAQGKGARALTSLDSQREFEPRAQRDPVALLLEQAATRVPDLVPIRHGRMLASPFSYYRGAALPMTVDLAGTPVSGLRVQLCGDAHLANFGAFASPERRLVFDINDFDETLPGPFEWDVKRLAASFAVAGRVAGVNAKTRRRVLLAMVGRYRTAMRGFAQLPMLQVWYSHLNIDDALTQYRQRFKPKRFQAIEQMIATARTHDNRQAARKLTTVVDGHRQVISDPPTVVPIEELLGDLDSHVIYDLLRTILSRYRRSLPSDRRYLLERFHLVQVARKVVGVGSVGQRAWVLLMDAVDVDDPLVLQAKQAEGSVLADFCGASRYGNQGERVVAGQRLMQATSDIFLGWTHGPDAGGVDRHYYIRQLRDWKFSFPIEQMRSEGLIIYGDLCGWTVARAHARSGDRVAIAAYLGRSDRFDQAIADFAEAYADQNERDYTTFQQAVAAGEVRATTGV